MATVSRWCLLQTTKSSRNFLRQFPQKNWTHRGLDWLLAKIDKYGMAEKLPCGGRPRTARTDDNVAAVEELLQSQEDKPQYGM